LAGNLNRVAAYQELCRQASAPRFSAGERGVRFACFKVKKSRGEISCAACSDPLEKIELCKDEEIG
jgi:hypothetical protein